MTKDDDELTIIETDRTTGEVTKYVGWEVKLYIFLGIMIPILIGFLIGFISGYSAKH